MGLGYLLECHCVRHFNFSNLSCQLSCQDIDKVNMVNLSKKLHQKISTDELLGWQKNQNMKHNPLNK